MIVLGAILLVLCLLLASGIALSNTDSISAEAFGVSLSNVSLGGLFLLGVAVGAVAMLGLGLVLAGAARKRHKKNEMRREVDSVRSEQARVAEENARLQQQLERERTAAVTPYGGDVVETGPGATRTLEPASADTLEPASAETDGPAGRHAL